MIEWLRKFLETPQGRISASCFLVVCIIAGLFSLKSSMADPADAFTSGTLYIDAKTGQSFKHTLAAGERIPLLGPSGEKAGYPAEICNWTKDGHVSTTETPVLINAMIGKPGPTFCPDCGRLVVAHNPRAVEGAAPPPTKEEYEKSHSRESE